MTADGDIPAWARPKTKKWGALALQFVFVGLLLAGAIARSGVIALLVLPILIILFAALYFVAIQINRRRIKKGSGMAASTPRDALRAWGWTPTSHSGVTGRVDPVLGRLTLNDNVLSWKPPSRLSSEFPGVHRPLSDVSFHEYTSLKRWYQQGYLHIVFLDASEWQFLVTEYPLFQALYSLPSPRPVAPPWT